MGVFAPRLRIGYRYLCVQHLIPCWLSSYNEGVEPGFSGRVENNTKAWLSSGVKNLIGLSHSPASIRKRLPQRYEPFGRRSVPVYQSGSFLACLQPACSGGGQR